MLEIFGKIWRFSDTEQKNIVKSMILVFINAIFYMLQMGAIFITLEGLLNDNVTSKLIWQVVGIMAVSVIGRIIAQCFSQTQQTHAGYFMASNKRIDIGNKMKLIPMGFFNQSSLGNITGICTTVMGDVELTAPEVMVLALGGFITAIVFALYILIFDLRMGIIVISGIICFCLLTSLMEKKSRMTAPKRQEAQAKLVENVLETVEGMSIVKSFNLTKVDNKKIDRAIEYSKKTNLGMERVLVPYTIMQQGVLRVFSVIMMGAAILFYIQGTMKLSFALMFIIASFIVFEQIESAGHSISILRVCGSSIEQAEQMDEVPVMDEKGRNIIPTSHDIELDHIGFSYEKRQILKDISAKIGDQTMTAIVGTSGSGKTTICNLIARFWDVDQGSIKIGGHDIKEYTLSSLMDQISMVFQNVYLFHDTIENNIKFGKPQATREDVIRAAKKACCHDFIMALPKGYDTVIGEGGTLLSGGEKQRVSIARAILKDAPIIILDEATASVDPENEALLQKAFEELTYHKTLIMIAHRLKTVRNADQIIVIDDGKIVQRGKHDELITEPGIYADFVKGREKADQWQITE